MGLGLPMRAPAERSTGVEERLRCHIVLYLVRPEELTVGRHDNLLRVRSKTHGTRKHETDGRSNSPDPCFAILRELGVPREHPSDVAFGRSHCPLDRPRCLLQRVAQPVAGVPFLLDTLVAPNRYSAPGRCELSDCFPRHEE